MSCNGVQAGRHAWLSIKKGMEEGDGYKLRCRRSIPLRLIVRMHLLARSMYKGGGGFSRCIAPEISHARSKFCNVAGRHARDTADGFISTRNIPIPNLLDLETQHSLHPQVMRLWPTIMKTARVPI